MQPRFLAFLLMTCPLACDGAADDERSETQTACGDYCTRLVECLGAEDENTAQACTEDCSAPGGRTDACMDADREMYRCLGALSCEEFISSDECDAEIDASQAACDDGSEPDTDG